MVRERPTSWCVARAMTSIDEAVDFVFRYYAVTHPKLGCFSLAVPPISNPQDSFHLIRFDVLVHIPGLKFRFPLFLSVGNEHY